MGPLRRDTGEGPMAALNLTQKILEEHLTAGDLRAGANCPPLLHAGG